jgi:hypothetical protein
MDLANTRLGGLVALLGAVVIPAAITALQVVHTRVATTLMAYPVVVIAFSTVYYLFNVLVPAWAGLYTDALGSHWFLLLLLLYLLWSTLLFALGQVVWSYAVLVLLLLFSIFLFRPLYRYAHPAFLALFLVGFLWVFYLFIMETAALFQGQY